MESAGTIHILSREVIKPSSQTPHHNRKLKLSYLDQLVASMYTPVIFFYQANESVAGNQSQISLHLKQSLSTTLTSFYPLAGTVDVQDSSFMDCNDQTGIEFIEARAHVHLEDAIHKNRDEDIDLHQYLPVDPTCCKRSLVTIKITFFDCGGISIGICFSHRMVDFGSFMGFVNAWAATCRGEIMDFSQYSFDLANHFPAGQPFDAVFMPTYDDNSVAKRFIFNEETLMLLKREATSPLVTNPTKVEAISTFIWKHLIEVAKSPKTLVATQLLNLRKRTKPPRSLENVFGNCIMVTSATYDPNRDIDIDSKELYHELVSRMRNSIAKINEDYITKAQSGDNYLNDIKEMMSILIKGDAERCGFSSWCKFPLYEVNFGWGKPIWVCTTRVPATNSIALMDTKCGKGIEAWINMREDTIQTLGTKIKLISTIAKGMD